MTRSPSPAASSTLTSLGPLAISLPLSIVVPAYNEEQRLEPTLRRYHAVLAARGQAFELVVVDDGSTDDTAGLVERLAPELPGLRVIRSYPNRGKGHAVRVGMLGARGAVRVMCDADGSMPPEELEKLLAPIAAGTAEIAIGSRYVAGAPHRMSQPLYRRLWSRLCNQVIQRALVPGVLDTQCGFKAFTAEAARDLFGRATVNGWAFDLEILALARRRGWALVEIGVIWVDDARSKVNPVRDLVKVVREALTIRRNLRDNVYGLPQAA
ncbi:MAG: glycosyltransferase family 2 protein [Kofleriaceae bacterium]|jgi:dolichyl-phosphate beta-glucosyltransferase|nr:glycosyltransferase family 2 protein [Kofleriaceae bacterium]MBP6835737.1 glycosyltransferase family 2 protein [Kofleriaceae bacterium]